jgi:Rv0078B-related antitoxin
MINVRKLPWRIVKRKDISKVPPTKPTPAQKLRIASMLYATARKVKTAALRRAHPEWSQVQLAEEVNRRFFMLHD